LSIFPKIKEKDPLNIINSNIKRIRHELNTRIKNQLKRMPELVFYIDDSIDYISNIENLIKK
jgi:ribosome-binding factor A